MIKMINCYMITLDFLTNVHIWKYPYIAYVGIESSRVPVLPIAFKNNVLSTLYAKFDLFFGRLFKVHM